MSFLSLEEIKKGQDLETLWYVGGYFRSEASEQQAAEGEEWMKLKAPN